MSESAPLYARLKDGKSEVENTALTWFDTVEVAHVQRTGFLPLVTVGEKPEVPSGQELWHRLAVNGGNVEKRYFLRAAPRTFSKLKCVAALMEAGVWDAVKGYIEEAGLYDLYLAAQDFREDNEYFLAGRARLQAALGWSDEQVEAVLAASVAGQ